jgi:hypothetical protein
MPRTALRFGLHGVSPCFVPLPSPLSLVAPTPRRHDGNLRRSPPLHAPPLKLLETLQRLIMMFLISRQSPLGPWEQADYVRGPPGLQAPARGPFTYAQRASEGRPASSVIGAEQAAVRAEKGVRERRDEAPRDARTGTPDEGTGAAAAAPSPSPAPPVPTTSAAAGRGNPSQPPPAKEERSPEAEEAAEEERELEETMQRLGVRPAAGENWEGSRAPLFPSFLGTLVPLALCTLLNMTLHFVLHVYC